MKTTKTVKVRIGKKHLKDAIYIDNYDCPLARALKGKGYTRVWVGSMTAVGYKNHKRVNFRIPRVAGDALIHRGEKPFVITLEVY